jgi:hypothetical protein
MSPEDSTVFEAGSEANHKALEWFRDLLKEAGFRVPRRDPRHSTLKVYVAPHVPYPLLNPRFVNGQIELTTWSKKGDLSLDQALMEVSTIPGCTVKQSGDVVNGYHCHGVIVMALQNQSSLSILFQKLVALHSVLAKYA